MDIQTVVREVTVRGSVQGMDQVASAYDKVSSSADDTAESVAKSGSNAAIAEAAIAKLGAQLQDNFQQQQQFNDAMRQQSQAYAQSMTAANDNTSAIKSNGLEWAEIVNHVRQATEVAYAFSPAFRGVVNAMAVPALSAAGTALEVVAAGLVTGTNLAGTGLVRLGTAAASTIPALAPVGGAVAAVGASLQAFNPSLASAATTIIGSLLPALRLLGPALLIYDAIKLVGEAWELGGQKLDEYRQIAEKAAAVDLSTSYFQKLMKGATDSKVPVDQLTTALQNLQKSSADALGNSALWQRIDASTDAGNFNNNPGVDQLAQANTTQEKYQAIVTLIHQAMQDGERLAAIDIAGTAFGPEAADHLRQDSEYFDKINEAAAKISDTQITSDADVSRALALKTQYDAAVAILEQRWHPIQNVLTQLGIQMHQTWVDIVSEIATAVDWVVKLAEKIATALGPMMDFLKTAGQYIGQGASLAGKAASTLPVVGAPISLMAGAVSYAAPAPDAGPVTAYSAAVDKLRIGLSNQNTVQQAVNQTNTVAQKVYGDTSHAIDNQTKAVEDSRDAYDRAVASAQKHYAETNADTDAVGKGVAAMAEFKTSAALTTAALQAQRDMTPQLTAEIDAYAKAAGAAAQANALAKASSAASFASQTIFMSPSDLAAANVMHNIYGDDWQSHMDDALAKQLKLNSELGSAKSTAESFASSFVQGLLSGKSAMESLTDAASQLASKLGDKAITDLFSGNFVQAGIEGVVAIGASIFAGDEKAKAALQEAQAQWAAMASQVSAFNLAAKGVTLGPLTNELQSLYSTSSQLVQAAFKAHDNAGAQQISDNFGASVGRIVDEFESGSSTLSDLQKSIKAVNDEAAGLIATTDEMGQTNGYAAGITASAITQVQNLISQFASNTASGLTSRLNAANGQDYLNSAQDVLTQHQQDLDNAAELGNSPAMMTQISATFAAEAQKVVNDAGLVGDQFNDFIKLFPEFPGVVTQSATAIQAAQDNFAALAKTITDYLNSVQIGSNSILSPQDQLNSAQSQFSSQLSLAQSGNTDALGSITQYASTLLDQAKSYYASSSGYDDIYRAVVTALSALTGIGGSTPYNPASALGTSVPSSSSLPGGPVGTALATPPASSNDNGDYFAAQTQALVSAIGAAATAEIGALQDGVNTLAARLDRVAAAIASNKPKAMRPAARAGAAA